MATTEALLTAEEFANLPDLGQPAELVGGQVIMMNMPAPLHGFICGNVCYVLRSHLAQHEIGRVFTNDTGVITRRNPDSVRGADVSYYSFERLPKGPIPSRYVSVAPELVFEVRSPDDAWRDILEKVAEYLAAGVLCVCVLDPEPETVTVYRPNHAEALLRGDEALELPDVLPGFSAPVKRFFA